MKSYNPDELTAKVKQEQEETSNLAVSTLQWFLDSDRIGELYPRGDVVRALSEHLGVDNSKASIALSSVVGDIVDPVQQVTTRQGKFVGIISYKVYDDSGAYGYVHFDDRRLKRKRVVCAKCVEEADLDGEVVHAEQGEGTSSEDASWEHLLNKVTSHYANAHSEAPREIEPGAALVSGTTISGNTSIHGGNQSSFPIDDFSVGTLADGEFLKNSSGSLVGGSASGSGGAVIQNSVTNYSDLPFNLSQREFYYVTLENDVVVQIDADLNIWKSISDFTTVARNIPDSLVDYDANAQSETGQYTDQQDNFDLTGSTSINTDATPNGQDAYYQSNNSVDNPSLSVSQPLVVVFVTNQGVTSGTNIYYDTTGSNTFTYNLDEISAGVNYTNQNTYPSNWTAIGHYFNGSESQEYYHEADGTTSNSEPIDLGTNTWDGVQFGSGNINGEYARIKIYDLNSPLDSDSTFVQDEVDSLANTYIL